MDSLNSERLKILKSKHELVIKEAENKVKAYEKYKDDYEKLRTKLSTMADERKQDIMVPIAAASNHCPLAYLPGYIKHTNEILVLLGDNWFVERTAKQSIEIVDRRLNKINEMIENCNQEIQQYKSWMQMTDEMINEQKGVEIIEEYNEESERKWREKHRENVRRQKQAEAEQRHKVNNEENIDEYFDEQEEDELNENEENLDKCSVDKEKSDLSTQQTSIIRKEKSDKKKSVSFDLTSIDESLKIVTEETVYPLPKPIYLHKEDTREHTDCPAAVERPIASASRLDSNVIPFTGQIIERPVNSEIISSASAQSDLNVQAKTKISKFKASRK